MKASSLRNAYDEWPAPFERHEHARGRSRCDNEDELASGTHTSSPLVLQAFVER